MAHSKKKKISYKKIFISVLISGLILFLGLYFTNNISSDLLYKKLFKPLVRLLFFITVGLLAGQFIEYTGWTRYFAVLGSPFFRFANLGKQCSSAFTAAFISGVTANAMLVDFYEEKKITKIQLFLSNFINQFPAYFLHLPTTFFIVIPLTGKAGILYFVLTFLATCFRTICFLLYGHFFVEPPVATEPLKDKENDKKRSGFLESIKKKFPSRVLNIITFVIPIYIAVFVLNSLGMFELANKLLSKFVITSFIPIESLSVVILSFAAEFTSGFAAAGAMLDAGVITTKQTVIALIIGNILAFPIRALRHQLPRYLGIFSPKMGLQILLMSQSFRISSLIMVTIIYYILF